MSGTFLNPPREFSVMPFWFWNDDLDEGERARVLIETAGAAAHEINQPLTVSIGLAQPMLNETPIDDPRRSNMESIVQFGERISQVVRKMKDVQQYNSVTSVGDTKIMDFGDADAGKQ